MNGRRTSPSRIAKLLLAVLFGLLSSLGESARAEASKQPNVVLIVSDDQSWTDFGFIGPSPRSETPHLDRLAEQSLFSHAGM